ncbi:MAG TPA: polysaccharide deacetylase family protein [Streptosporangiaceae bacterium]|nr:polysaccharide deacetylase family protein [Streptosporangiaceae bacterium]
MIALTACSSEHRSVTSAAKTAAGQKHRPAKASPTAKVDCHVRKCIALTFDDGPVPGTGQLLDILKANGAKATFFVLGSQVGTNYDMLKREAAEGHEIGNHTFTHAKLAGAPTAMVESEITRTQDAIEKVIGKLPLVFRPTYGATDKQLDAITKHDALAQILWSVDTIDWRDRNTALVKERVLKGAQPGYIILMHDIRPTTVAAVPDILQTLSKQGYAFVTISELYGGQLTPGEKYPPFLGSPTAGPAPATP